MKLIEKIRKHDDTDLPVTDTHTEPQRKHGLNPARLIILAMLLIILAGAFLLSLPLSNRSGRWLRADDAIFTSFSAVCVVGLVTKDIALTFTGFGQVVLLLLIQTGGLGFMSIASLFFLLLRRRVGLKNRLAMQEAMNEKHTGGIMRLMRNVIIFTFAFELFGFLLMLPVFVPLYGGRGVFVALFMAVSSFCNAGFDIFGTADAPFVSLTATHNTLFLLTVLILIFVGGLGFAVISDIFSKRRFGKFSLHTKIVIITACAIDLVSFLFYLTAEYSNPATLGGEGFFKKALLSLFQAVSARTSGFAVISQDGLTAAAKFYTGVMMIIGSAPASTGGGIKITTVAVLFLLTISDMTGKDDIIVGKHTLSRRTGTRAVTILLYALVVFIIGTTLLMLSQPATLPGDTLFEIAASFGTGMSTGVTTTLGVFGKILIMLIMFAIRIGPITIGLAIFKKNNAAGLLKYPEAHVMLG